MIQFYLKAFGPPEPIEEIFDNTPAGKEKAASYIGKASADITKYGARSAAAFKKARSAQRTGGLTPEIKSANKAAAADRYKSGSRAIGVMKAAKRLHGADATHAKIIGDQASSDYYTHTVTKGNTTNATQDRDVFKRSGGREVSAGRIRQGGKPSWDK